MGPVGSRRGRPASRRRAEPAGREGPKPEPTSLGTEWRCGDPSAGTAGQATRLSHQGARVGPTEEAWCWTRKDGEHSAG